MLKILLTGLAATLLLSCFSYKTEFGNTTITAEAGNVQQEAQAFVYTHSTRFQEFYTISAEAEWASNTCIMEGDTTNAAATRRANEG